MPSEFGPTMSWSTAQKRAAILNRIRDFFASRNIIEVETPILSAACSIDCHLRHFFRGVLTGARDSGF